MKDINQQLRFNVKSQVKTINFNNVEVIAVNFHNIKKSCL